MSLHSHVVLPSLPSAMTGGRAVSREEVRFHGDTIPQVTRANLHARGQLKDAGRANDLAAEQTPPTQSDDQVQVTNQEATNLVGHHVLLHSNEYGNFYLGEFNHRDRVLFAANMLKYMAPAFTNRVLVN